MGPGVGDVTVDDADGVAGAASIAAIGIVIIVRPEGAFGAVIGMVGIVVRRPCCAHSGGADACIACVCCDATGALLDGVLALIGIVGIVRRTPLVSGGAAVVGCGEGGGRWLAPRKLIVWATTPGGVDDEGCAGGVAPRNDAVAA